MPEYNGSASRQWADAVESALSQIDSIARRMRREVKSPAQIPIYEAEMRAVAARLSIDSEKWLKAGLPETYKTEFKAIAGDKPIPAADRDWIYRRRQKTRAGVAKVNASLDNHAREIAKDVMRGKQKAALEAEILNLQRLSKKANNPLEKRLVANKITQRMQELKALKQAGVDPAPTVSYKPKSAGSTPKLMPTETYANMLARTAHSEHANYGLVSGAIAAGRSKVYVLDGEGCGWKSHDDSEKANGKIVDLATEDIIMLSHPNCQRSFTVEKPWKGGSKRDWLKNQRAASLSRGQSPSVQMIQRMAAKNMSRGEIKGNLSKFLAFASVAGEVVNSGIRFSRSPLIQRMAWSIANDESVQLPQGVRNFMRRFSDFSARENAVLAQMGKQIGAETAEEVRMQVQATVDDVLVAAGNAGQVRQLELPDFVVRVLGANGRYVSRDELLERYSLYNDYHRREVYTGRAWYENVRDMQINQAVRDELIPDVAAIDWWTSSARPATLPSTTKGLMKAFKNFVQEDPLWTEREVVRAFSELTRVPFAKANVGPLRFSVGLSQEGRGNLAVKLWDKVKEDEVRASRWFAEEVKWAERYGINLDDRFQFTKDDIVEALLPRVSWTTLPFMHATIGATRGQLIPAIRVFPPGVLSKIISFEARLRSPAMNEFLGDVNDAIVSKNFTPRWLTTRLLGGFEQRQVYVFNKELGKSELQWETVEIKGLLDDTIFTLNFFRNGPISAYYRLYGLSGESYGVRISPNDLYRSSFVKKLKQPIAETFDDAGKKILLTDQQILDMGGDPLTMTRSFWASDAVLLPTVKGGIRLSYENGLHDLTLMKFHIWKGNLMDVAKDLRIDYNDLVRWYGQMKETVGDYMQFYRGWDYRNIRTVNDFRKIADDVLYSGRVTSPAQDTWNRLFGKFNPSDDVVVGKFLTDKGLREEYPETFHAVDRVIKRKGEQALAGLPVNASRAYEELEGILDRLEDTPLMSRDYSEIMAIFTRSTMERLGLQIRGYVAVEDAMNPYTRRLAMKKANLGSPDYMGPGRSLGDYRMPLFIDTTPEEMLREFGSPVLGLYRFNKNEIAMLGGYGEWREQFQKVTRSGILSNFLTGTLDAESAVVHELGHWVTDIIATRPEQFKKFLLSLGEWGGWPRTSGQWRYIDLDGIERSGTLTRPQYYEALRSGRLREQLMAEVDFPFERLREATDVTDMLGIIDEFIQLPDIQRLLGEGLSNYGASKFIETIAEAFNQALTTKMPQGSIGDFLFKKMMEAMVNI